MGGRQRREGDIGGMSRREILWKAGRYAGRLKGKKDREEEPIVRNERNEEKSSEGGNEGRQEERTNG